MYMNPVVHFEMPYDDAGRMADFYKKAFGWQMNVMGPEMGNYVVAWTAETDPQTRMVKNPGQINGGFFKKSPENASPSVVIAVKDIEAAMKAVTDAGGEVKFLENDKPMEIPGIGLYAGFIDTEGNRVSLLQPHA
jgi:predicted enzyme related to lactoylglutathione lyase